MLKVENILFSYQQTPIVSDISFKAKKGEHISIIGESGSGKTTLLKLLFGEFDLNKGKVFWNNQQILGPKHNLITGYDFMKFVTQEFDLMPFISVEDNIGKHLSRLYPEERQERINTLLKVVELEPFAKTKVQYLSGGQKQRVAIARTLAVNPHLLLLDEPFSNLDYSLKSELRVEIKQLVKKLKISMLFITHDISDALAIAEEVIFIKDGVLQWHGSISELSTNIENQEVKKILVDVKTSAKHTLDLLE